MTVIQTKMAAAFCKAFDACVAEGGNPGRIGHRILTNKAAGIGVKFRPKLTLKKKVKVEHKAESAVEMEAAGVQ